MATYLLRTLTPYMSNCYALAISLLWISIILPVANSVSFQFSRFDSSSNILYQGDAVNSVGAIEFNKVNYLDRVGLITYANKPPGTYGHGVTFFIAPAGFQIPPNSDGGFLGLFNTTTSDSPSNQLIVVEFDAFSNPEWDPPYEHVGINNNSIASLVNTHWNASLHSGDTADAWIVYNSTTKNLTVFWSYREEANYSRNSSLSLQIDLRKTIPEFVSIGLSAATGKYVERHNLQSWEFNSNLESKVPKMSHSKKSKLEIGLIVPLCLMILIGIVVLLLYRRRRWTRRKQAEAASFNDEFEREAGPRKFMYPELVTATHNFSSERKLGEGGFGCVYKGYLIELDIPIAVKKTSRGSKHGQKQYITEVKIISRLRHRNLVQLIGWCHSHGDFLLVYEFMPNGSLDAHLFGKKMPLSWFLRYKITLGVGSGLLYLHEEWEQCVVHRDIKSSNIMLDSSFNVKLGDFGLARLMDHELGGQTTGLAGTFGYMAPEYISTGKASKESDVYSFGVVVLEIVTGKKSMDCMVVGTDQMGLIEWVWDLYGRGELLSAIDKSLDKDMVYDAKQAGCLLTVGLWCAHPDHSERPSIRQAIQALNFEAALPSLPPKMPVPFYHVPLPSLSSSGPSLTLTSLEIGR